LKSIQGFEEAKMRANFWFARLTGTAFAKNIPSPWGRSSRTEPSRRSRSALAFHLDHLHTVLLPIFSCSLFLVVTGCGANVTVEHLPGTLAASPTAVAFGNVTVGQAANSTITLRAGSSGSVQITAFGVSGQGFALSGQAALPITIAAGGTYDLDVQFSPVATGAVAGQITVTGTSSTNGTVAVGLSGTGTSASATTALSALSCVGASITGSGTDSCTVTLTAAAGSGGFAVGLSSSSSAVTVPASVTIAAGATTATFTATASAVAIAQTVTLKASAGTVSENFNLQLNVLSGPVLSINATSIGFGNVVLNTPATQTVILSSTGTSSVMVNSATVSGTGFTLSGPTFPQTLTPGQTATLGVQFDPTVLGAATSVLTIVSTSSSNGTAVIDLGGTGIASSYVVNLSWDAPTDSPVPVSGYNVYRSPAGSSSYELLNSSVDTSTTYVDSTVQDGLSYDYTIESVGQSGVRSGPTSPVNVTIP
jgi:Abnormal spindle-like microcephaly-assoc'd, ASPM-SPD-2-Hydin